jgi:hypothetical protein
MKMQQIIIAYYIADDVVKSLEIREDKQIMMTITEVITTAVAACMQYLIMYGKLSLKF